MFINVWRLRSTWVSKHWGGSNNYIRSTRKINQVWCLSKWKIQNKNLFHTPSFIKDYPAYYPHLLHVLLSLCAITLLGQTTISQQSLQTFICITEGPHSSVKSNYIPRIYYIPYITCQNKDKNIWEAEKHEEFLILVYSVWTITGFS